MKKHKNKDEDAALLAMAKEAEKEPDMDFPQDLLDKKIREKWLTYVFSVPPTFYTIMIETIEAYKHIRDTEEEFPALEAIFMEARNSLPQEILEALSDDVG